MNEADTPNNGAFNEPQNPASAPQPQQASCPFYSVLPLENKIISQLPLLAPAPDQQCQEDASCQDSMTETNQQIEETSNSEYILELNQQQLEELKPELDWVAEPEKEKQALIDSEFKQLLALNEELRSANNDLYEQIKSLKTALSESEGAVQWQQKRSTVAESMLNQQTQELNAAQEQIKSLYQQLETALQTVQTQETVIENYKAQLEINQQRLALLERECTLLQTKYNEQSHQLLQSENSCRELRTRLMRQQRQTLQFKAALEKCLETPPPSSDSTDAYTNTNNVGNEHARNYQRTHSLLPNQQPIQPWSAEADSSTEDTDRFRVESSCSNPYPWDNSTSNQSSTTDTPSQESTLTPEQTTIEPEIDDDTGSQTISSSDSLSLDEQVDNLIQLFFAAQTTFVSPPLLVEKDPEDIEEAKNDDQSVTPIWEIVATPVEDTEDTEDTKESIIVISPSADTDSEENEDLWLDMSPLPPSLPGSDESDKSPSPVVYPERPPKGRKSLASVELPNFRPKK
ncbi:hypothetical protein ACE1AT_11265 [Pelatocladus sp. BLCC-F211]|uniref:hypothetical protein n=1 Tax=Pelatocladus sp. BLCC-F211 TaxID=3342752 RepID=UPI0035B79A68